MSWHYLPVEAGVCSVVSCSGGERSAMSKKTSTASTSSKPESETDISTTLPSGTTLRHSTGDPGLDRWISSQQASLVNLSQLPEKEKAKKTTETSGQTPLESLARYDRDTRSWRMCQGSLLSLMPDEYSATWPKTGTMRDGVCYLLPMSARRTYERGSGLWLTPTAKEGNHGNPKAVEAWEAAEKDGRRPKKSHQRLGNQVKVWPTPTQTGNNNRKGLSAKSGDGLATAAKRYPTPSVMDAAGFCGKPDKGRTGPNSGRTLTGKVLETEGLGPHTKLWPTPNAGDGTRGPRKPDGKRGLLLTDCAAAGGRRKFPTPKGTASGPDYARTNREKSGGDDLATNIARQTPGQLNPMWVEWLQGWPLGWTDCAPLEMDKFQQWLEQHGCCLEVMND